MSFLAPAALFFLLASQMAMTFEILDIASGHNIAAQIGARLVLNCCTTGCESPEFSWRTQLDNPLGGIVSRQGSNSSLTLASVGFEHEQNYVCNAICGSERKERRVQIDIYSFPSDPIIEINGPLVLGKPSTISCHVPKVYPSECLLLSFKREGKVLKEEEFFHEEPTKSLETKTVTVIFTPTEEDIGKEITCIAELPIEEMEFEPKQRQAKHLLDVNFGPRNTHLTASPGKTLLEGEALTLSCKTESHPPAKVVWKKQLANDTVQQIAESDYFSIPNVQFSDSGIYICEATNDVTNEVEKRMVSLSVQGAPRHLEFSFLPGSTVQEGESVTLQCSAESDPAATVVIRRKFPRETEVQGGFVHIPRVSLDDAGDYECQAENQFGTINRTTSLIVESFSPTTPTVTDGPEITTEVEDFTIKTTASDAPQQEADHLENSTPPAPQVFSPTTPTVTDGPKITTEVEDFTLKTTASDAPQQEADHLEDTTPLAPQGTLSQLYTTSKNNTTTYVVDNDISNGTEVIGIFLDEIKEPDYVIPVIVVVSVLATAAGPMTALMIYIFRKAKINGSYSLVKSLKPEV
nr:PREDICTED: vascular cell adhesion protein 1 [Anolis carolinensis]|eukprot:XP_008107356.1 PREDICTED: vascular cell adhesion protein 1 [Anolis carolinensis]